MLSVAITKIYMENNAPPEPLNVQQKMEWHNLQNRDREGKKEKSKRALNLCILWA